MKKAYITLLLSILSNILFAQNRTDSRNEFSTEIGSYRGNSMSNSYFFRQKYMHWFSRHIRVLVSNMRSNQTVDIPIVEYYSEYNGSPNNTGLLRTKLRQTNNRYIRFKRSDQVCYTKT